MDSSKPKFVDILEEDKPIAGQKYVCVSFISPDKIIKQKEMFFFEQFLKHFDFSKSMTKFQQFLNFISYKHNLNFEKVMDDYQEFIKTEKDNLIDDTLESEYKTFLDHKEEDLEKYFSEQHNFQTSVRGVKIRGAFPTQQEAELRCKLLREQDPNHDIFVGPVGVWMPWEPEAYKTGKVEYLEQELNQLMHEKNKNDQKAKQHFDDRVRETKEKAIQENIERAKESGNKLTQTIDEEGNLIGVSGTNTTETALEQNEVISSTDIAKELFTGDTIRTKASDKLQK
jgi:hypothetical protein